MRELNLAEPIFYGTIFHLHMAYKVKQMSSMLNPYFYDANFGVKVCILFKLHFKRQHLAHVNEMFS